MIGDGGNAGGVGGSGGSGGGAGGAGGDGGGGGGEGSDGSGGSDTPPVAPSKEELLSELPAEAQAVAVDLGPASMGKTAEELTGKKAVRRYVVELEDVRAARRVHLVDPLGGSCWTLQTPPPDPAVP